MTTLLRRRAARRALPLLLAAAAALALPACSSDPDPAPAGTTAGPDTDLGAAEKKVTEGQGGPVDACALLQPAEVQALVPGAPAKGEEQGTGYCTWEDPATSDSVTVRIGSTGTAIDGKLPAPDPDGPNPGYEDGPDGIRFSMGGTVAEFVAGTRACDVQVVNGKDVRTALVGLVGTLKTRVDS